MGRDLRSALWMATLIFAGEWPATWGCIGTIRPVSSASWAFQNSQSGLVIWSIPRNLSTLPDNKISESLGSFMYLRNHVQVMTFVPSDTRARVIIRLREIRRCSTSITVPPTVTSSSSGTAERSKICDLSR